MTRLFYQDMVKYGRGEILNVISCLDSPNELTAEMFHHTQALLMEEANKLNEASPTKKVRVHTLAYSPQSFTLQTDHIPEDISPDLIPDLCSAKEIADYGYQILQARRNRKL